MSSIDPTYILLTAARNEAKRIARTLDSVTRQVVRPVEWIICLNDSTDETGRIVSSCAASFPFVSLQTVRLGQARSFRNKSLALAAGYKRARGLACDYIGILDADISFEPAFFGELIGQFAGNPRLGIVSPVCFEEEGNDRRPLPFHRDLAVGAVQLFRTACFEAVGGYRPLQWGGEDTLACTLAQMAGWQTKTAAGVGYGHGRVMGSGESGGVLRARFREGIRDRKLGMDPVYAFCKAAMRVREHPRYASALARLAGYAAAIALPPDPNVPAACRAFFRNRQRQHLKSVFRRTGRNHETPLHIE